MTFNKASYAMDILDFYENNDYQPDTGMLLIAEPCLKDPGFSRSVILLCEHGRHGTLGFVLNKPSANTLDMLLPELTLPGIRIFEGGPVQTDALQIIHRLPEYLGGIEILPDIYWGASYEELSRLCNLKMKIDPASIRLFRGYSGWDMGQLEQELHQNSWITAPAGEDLIFNTDNETTWSLALKSLGENFSFLANLPVDPILN